MANTVSHDQAERLLSQLETAVALGNSTGADVVRYDIGMDHVVVHCEFRVTD